MKKFSVVLFLAMLLLVIILASANHKSDKTNNRNRSGVQKSNRNQGRGSDRRREHDESGGGYWISSEHDTPGRGVVEWNFPWKKVEFIKCVLRDLFKRYGFPGKGKQSSGSAEAYERRIKNIEKCFGKAGRGEVERNFPRKKEEFIKCVLTELFHPFGFTGKQRRSAKRMAGYGVPSGVVGNLISDIRRFGWGKHTFVLHSIEKCFGKEDIDYCDGITCANGGTCFNDTTSYICDCAEGYEGTNCTTDIDDCVGLPCLNGGTCKDGTNSYTCDCADGYEGNECQTDIDDCADLPCLNGGTCVDGANLYTCNCAEGYDGTNCETASPTTPEPASGTCTQVDDDDLSCISLAKCNDRGGEQIDATCGSPDLICCLKRAAPCEPPFCF